MLGKEDLWSQPYGASAPGGVDLSLSGLQIDVEFQTGLSIFIEFCRPYLGR
jgi:hypothetical protein